MQHDQNLDDALASGQRLERLVDHRPEHPAAVGYPPSAPASGFSAIARSRHRRWSSQRTDALCSWLIENLKMQVVTPVLQRLVFLHSDAVRIRIGIVAEASHLPGYLAARLATSDLEAIAGNLIRDMQVCCRERGSSRW